MHIGSQITEVEPYREAISKVVPFASRCRDRGHPIEWINAGGGFGIDYEGHRDRSPADFAEVLVPVAKEAGFRLTLEPGRSLAGPAGILVTEVIYVKRSGPKTFVICDAGMNDLIRPSLYDAYHRVWPLVATAGPGLEGEGDGRIRADIVGPICESGDFLALDRVLPAVERGDRLVVFSAGAYGSVMASNYNTRPRPAEVFVSGDRFSVVRERETFDDLLRRERIPEGL